MAELSLGNERPEEARARVAPLLDLVLGASTLVLVGCLSLTLLHGRRAGVWPYVLCLACTIVAAHLRQVGRDRAAGVVLSLGFFAVASAGVFLLGGAQSPAVFVLVPVVLTAAIFWSPRAAAVLAMASVVEVLLATWMDRLALLPLPTTPPAVLWRVFAGSLALTTVLIGAAMRSLQAAAAEARGRADELAAQLRENPDGVAVLDDLGFVHAVNPAGLAFGGFGAENIVGRHFSTLPGLQGGDRTTAMRMFARLAAGSTETIELHLVRKDGSLYWGELRARRGLDDGRIHLTLRDVTSRKVAETRSAALEDELFQARNLEALGRSSAAVAHDVNNLLTVVLMTSSLLERRVHGENASLLESLRVATDRAVGLTRRMLALGRRARPDPRNVDLNAVVDGLRPLLHQLVGAQVELDLCLDARPCTVFADPVQLEQIVVNLATNARDAMPDGGTLTIETAKGTGGPSTGDWIALRVTDTGRGIDEETQRRIFDPFFTTKGAAGTGLGLSNVRELAAAARGKVRVESHVGRGARFEVLLPLASATA